MGNETKRSESGQTDAMRRAIAGNAAPLDYITGNEAAVKAAKVRDKASHYVPWEEGEHQNAKGQDEKASDPIGIPKERRYWGRNGQRRKGHIRNNVEQRTLRSIRFGK